MIDHKLYKFKVSELNITTTDITNYITGSSGELPDVFLSSVNRILFKITDLEIYAGYISYNVFLKADKLTVNNIEFLIGGEVGLLLKNSHEIAVFVCTVGDGFEKELQEFTKLEDSYVIDIIGTVVVEKSIEKLLNTIQKEVDSKNLKITNTISPGNCGWLISEQEKLFRLLPKNFLGITLNSSGMMYPVKSISGIVGIGKNVSLKHTECELCTSKNCMFRKAKYNN